MEQVLKNHPKCILKFIGDLFRKPNIRDIINKTAKLIKNDQSPNDNWVLRPHTLTDWRNVLQIDYGLNNKEIIEQHELTEEEEEVVVEEEEIDDFNKEDKDIGQRVIFTDGGDYESTTKDSSTGAPGGYSKRESVSNYSRRRSSIPFQHHLNKYDSKLKMNYNQSVNFQPKVFPSNESIITLSFVDDIDHNIEQYLTDVYGHVSITKNIDSNTYNDDDDDHDDNDKQTTDPVKHESFHSN